MIDELQAAHDFMNFRRLFTDSDADRKRLREMELKFPNPTHPVVRTVEDADCKVLYVNPQFTKQVVGLSEAESPCCNCCSTRCTCLSISAVCAGSQARSRSGTTVRPSTTNNDYYPNRRRMERVAVMGDRPV